MGIRFYCPNGHKLNVKTFQAGQKGICPVCGVKMQIPLESTRPSSRSKPRDALVPAAGRATAAGAPGGRNQQTPAEHQGADKAIGPICQNGPPDAGHKLDPSPFPPADPLAEEATWYVRPATGGQFGPATSEIMRIWLTEGRIAADTLVWRDGWRDWQEAQGVFRSAPSNGSLDGPNPGHSVPVAAKTPAASARRRQSESSPDARRMLLTVLVIAGLILVAVAAVLLAIFLGHR